MPHPSRRPSAFSLVELLVVISIVAVMISLMIPALSTAREAAQSLKCMSNLRQLYPGFQTYVLDQRGYWTVHGYQDNILWSRIVTKNLGLRYIGEYKVNIDKQTWNDGSDQGYGAPLYTYNKDAVNRKNLLMKCPTENFTNYWGAENATSYRYNSGNSLGYAMGNTDAYTVSTNATYREKWGRIRDHDIKRTTSVAVIADGIPGNGSYEYEAASLATLARFPNYHNGGNNILFPDGHAANMHRTALTNQIFDRR